METTLGEELLLLSLDDTWGYEKEPAKVAWAIAAASLVDLALAERIEVTDEVVSVRDPAPLGVPGLDAALADIAGYDKPGKVKDWMHHLRKPAMSGATDGLVEKGLVRKETKKVLGLFPVRRYPEVDGSAEASVRERLDEVVLRGGTPDDRTAGLVALLHGAKLHKLAFPDGNARAVESRMAEIAQGQWSSPAIRSIIDAAETALTAMVATTAIVAVTATG
ncbi:GPP34 family phosphoprotein [Streptomyces sp. NPDC102274]|uniref:GOLPH3/VPS74 family protein n=1 Tax=Streptomyces sp. NPDC102274 TaxID=3366151 RepID=UPI0037F5053C